MENKEYIFPGAINEIQKILEQSESKNILLVRGNKSYIKSGAKQSLEPIFQKYNIVEFTDFSVNPKLEEAKKGYKLFTQNNIDTIIAVGGGSVLDTAKIIKYLAIQENSSNTTIPFIAIPTTAGTGSEATHFAVVYIEGVKHSWAHQALVPTTAIVDANLLAGQSSYQMAVSGLDAFAQGIESLWSVNSTDQSRAYSKMAIKQLWENLEKAIAGDDNARTKIAESSNWAGKAINIAKTTAAHALSYGFTSELGLPHGHAVSLSLPFFMTLHQNIAPEQCNDKRGVTHLHKVISEISDILNTEENKLDKTILEFYKKIDVCTNFNTLNIDKQIFDQVTKQINYERLKNNPVNITPKTLKNLFTYNKNLS